jgi:LDH2 family malate/lactate/ureidoglycolate dehydrogenase
LMGVSPIACAGAEKPFILDMAPSIAARGKIYKAARRGEKLPLDWALDTDGMIQTRRCWTGSCFRWAAPRVLLPCLV